MATLPGRAFRWEKIDPAEFATSDTVWREYLAEQGVSAAVLSLQLRGAGGQRHAYLVGLDEGRSDPLLAGDLLEYCENLWRRAADGESWSPTAEEMRQTALFDKVRAPEALGSILAGLGHGLTIEAHYKLASVRAIFFRSAGAPPFDAREKRELKTVLPLLVEHGVARARLAGESKRTGLLEAVVDRVSVPILIVEASGLPVFCNSAAKALLNSRKYLLRATDGTLTCVNTRQARTLKGAIASAALARSRDADRIVRLDSGAGTWRLAHIVSAQSAGCDAHPGCAIMIILAPGIAVVPDAVLEALGLLPSEQRFLGRFLRSSSVGDAARHCGISEETARTYLKRVRAKLGVNRQMELANLISGLVPPIVAGTRIEGY
ncbi:MAG: helix-turn-helix transcriptional regulator [Cypionkella sp.]